MISWTAHRVARLDTPIAWYSSRQKKIPATHFFPRSVDAGSETDLDLETQRTPSRLFHDRIDKILCPPMRFCPGKKESLQKENLRRNLQSTFQTLVSIRQIERKGQRGVHTEMASASMRAISGEKNGSWGKIISQSDNIVYLIVIIINHFRTGIM